MFSRSINQAWSVGKREIVLDKKICAMIGVGGFIIATALAAYAKIYLPFTPVPITLQTLFVLLSGAVLGKKLGGISQLSYLILGGIGLPIFAGIGGMLYFFGPTGGYLIGFLFASWVVGEMLEKKSNLPWIVISFLSGTLIIYFFGMVHLSVVMKIGMSKAFVLGVAPFIPGGLLKIILATLLYHKYQTRFKTIFK
ncbi:biotin transporter BioY [bacterium]|nr:biotin transporter BioY [bacterium]